MPNKSIFLTRKDFQTTADSAFKGLFESNEFTDITLVSDDGQTIKAHKHIISTSSSMLNKLTENSEIACIDVKHSFLKLIIQFIYTGQCEVAKNYILHIINN